MLANQYEQVGRPRYSGLISTRFMVSMPSFTFKRFLTQLGHESWYSSAFVRLARAGWSSETGNELTRLFSALLSRALLRYLYTYC